jgi:hypothetical protein
MPALAQDKAPPQKGFGSLDKSLLIPGWGQFAEKRYLEGAAFLAAETFCLYKIFSVNRLGNKNYILYQRAETRDDAVRYRQLTKKYDTRRNQFMLAAAAVWAVNLFDIYLIVKNKEKKKNAFVLKIEQGEHRRMSLTASFRF